MNCQPLPTLFILRWMNLKFPDRDSIKTRISQPPDTGTLTLLQRPVDRPTLFLRLYPRDGADGAAISGVSALIFHAVPLRLVSICRGNNAAAPGRVPMLRRKT
ncbi:hypothetical protein OUZ56_025132 [Daphnia magna]|uniref:Uncharacterized protein n=1 Tax=Daphnia magna TaxID=35525 RepID=A0ABQ9ZIX9_9CRUS|nr:hypothetical protein OUZ56_025132 [Daphnia magna]